MDASLKARIQAQKECKEAIRNAGYNGAAIASVGFGKGKVIIDLARELVEKEQRPLRILYLCDNRRLRDSEKEGFPEQLEKWGTPEFKKMVQLECYQTACKWVDKEYDLLLADEADFAMTPVYSNVFFRCKFKYKILVSGTLTLAKKALLTKIVPIVFRCNTQDAEQRGIINKTNYYAYNYRMTDEESVRYERFGRKIAIAMAMGDEKKAQYWVSQRKEFLYKLDSSYKHTRKLMRWLWEKNKQTRLVIFCQRTEQADRVCKYSYHGKNEKADNLSLFQKLSISCISVVSKIKRGINLKNANTAIFEALDGSTTEFEQRNGRMKRLPVAELADVIFMNPWYKTTDSDGNEIYKETIVAQWIGKSTGNLTSITIHDLKV